MPRKEEQYRMKRQSPQKPPAKPAGSRQSALSPEERRRREARRREEARLAREAAIRQKQKRRERRKYLFRVSLTVGLVFVALYWCWVALAIATRPDGNEDALPLMLFTEGERKEDRTLKADEVNFGGKLYVPVTVLEDYMAISQFGDYETRSFLLCDSGEYATFYLGTPNAIINGQRVCLKENVFLRDDVLYLPVDFFTDKMNCFTYAQSVPLGAGVLTFRDDVTPALPFYEEKDSATVDPATIPVAPAPAEPTA